MGGPRTARYTVARAAALWVAIALLIAGCDPAWSSSNPSSISACWNLPGDGDVQSIAWAPDERDVWVLHGRGLAPRSLSRISVEPHDDNVQTVDLPGDATGPLAVDETDRPIWLTATPEGDASLDSLASSQQVVLGPLPHPRYLRFYWRAKTSAANGGLVALEMANMDDATFRLATIDVRGPISVAPITPAEDHLIDAAVSSDGSAIVTDRRGPNGSSVLQFLGTQTQRQHMVDGTIDLLDVWPAGQRVFFRAGSAAVMSWNVSTGAVSTITENDVYAYAVSSRGKIATSRFTQNGPTLTVCVSDL